MQDWRSGLTGVRSWRKKWSILAILIPKMKLLLILRRQLLWRHGLLQQVRRRYNSSWDWQTTIVDLSRILQKLLNHCINLQNEPHHFCGCQKSKDFVTCCIWGRRPYRNWISSTGQGTGILCRSGITPVPLVHNTRHPWSHTEEPSSSPKCYCLLTHADGCHSHAGTSPAHCGWKQIHLGGCRLLYQMDWSVCNPQPRSYYHCPQAVRWDVLPFCSAWKTSFWPGQTIWSRGDYPVVPVSTDEKTQTTPHHPQSDGLVEQFIRTQ